MADTTGELDRIDRSSTIVGPERGQMEWSKDWKATAALINQFSDHVEKAMWQAAPEDANVAIAAMGLINRLSDEDRRTYLYMDVADRLPVGNGVIPPDVLSVYDLPPSEVNGIVGSIRAGEDRPARHFRRSDSEALSSVASLLHFSNLALIIKNEGHTDPRMKLVMGSTSLGGYNSIAYPIHYVEITTASDEPLKVDFNNYSYGFHHPITQELPHHPDVTVALKGEFADVVKKYTNNRDEFMQQRKPDGDINDPTQLYGFLFNYLGNTYLPNMLPRGEYDVLQRRVSSIVTPWQAASRGGTLTSAHEAAYKERYFTAYQKGLESVRRVRAPGR